jgi:hypothetical protein
MDSSSTPEEEEGSLAPLSIKDTRAISGYICASEDAITQTFKLSSYGPFGFS